MLSADWEQLLLQVEDVKHLFLSGGRVLRFCKHMTTNHVILVCPSFWVCDNHGRVK